MRWFEIAVAVLVLVVLVRREYRHYRRITNRNSSHSVATGPKKSPSQDESGTGVEYGGTHLP